MPDNIRREYHNNDIRGTACGYMRKVAEIENRVTCFYCLKILERQKLLERLADNTRIEG